MTVGGTVLEVDPPRALVYTWNPSWESIPETTVRYTLTRTDRMGTLVEVHHTGFGDHTQVAKGHEEGWRRVLAWLAEGANR